MWLCQPITVPRWTVTLAPRSHPAALEVALPRKAPPRWNSSSVIWDSNSSVISLPTGISSILAFPTQRLLSHNNLQTWDVCLEAASEQTFVQNADTSRHRRYQLTSTPTRPDVLSAPLLPTHGRLQRPTATGTRSGISCLPGPASTLAPMCRLLHLHQPPPPRPLSLWSVPQPWHGTKRKNRSEPG